jgi:hypothetical protein
MWLAIAAWLGFLVLGLGWIAIETGVTKPSAGLFCESVRPSQGGDVRWELTPPGYYCEWEEDGRFVRSRASYFPTIFVTLAVSAGWAIMAVGRRLDEPAGPAIGAS